MKADRFKVAFAATVLGAVTSPAHAHSITGDLIEAQARGTRSFGRDLTSAFLGLGYHALTDRPLRNTGLLCATALVWSVCYVIARLTAARLGWLELTSDSVADCLAAGGWRSVALLTTLIAAGLATGTVFTVAARAAAHAAGAASAILPLTAAFLLASPALAIADLIGPAGLTLHCLLTYVVVLPLCYALPLLLGAALGRACRRPRSLPAAT